MKGVWHLAQAAMPPARKAIDSTLYKSDATVSDATACSNQSMY